MAASTSKQTPTHSRTLFLGSEGVPLRFYVRPGPTKISVFPLVVHGGGVMCRHREWGAILLTELEETGRPPKGYTRARYVLDCVEKNKQLLLEDYGSQRASPQRASPQRASPPRASPPRASPPRAEVRQAQPSAGRTQFSKLDDVAILMYLRSHVKESGRSVRGRVVWQEMERIQLTAHPWQSMRSRYLRYLCGREHLYQLDSRSVIPTAIFPKLNGPEEASARPAPKPEAAQGGKGKKNPDSRQHINKEEAAASVERVSDGVNSEEECFNVFPVAIREFEVEDDTPELVNIGDELETKKVPQEQQMETDQPLQVNPAKPRPKHKETLAGFVMDNEQSELDSQTPVDELSSLPTASQDEVECAIKAINTLMQTHNLDLCAATQLLLKNSGELTAALHFMETGHRPDGYPIWTHRDDLDLEKADRKVQEWLIQKFGSDNLAKRIAFRKS